MIENIFLRSSITRLESYKRLADEAIAKLTEEQLFYRPNNSSNSIAMIVHHMYGNMLSRWTNFLTEDGEKPWRMRDAEFEDFHCSKDELLQKWNDGWNCLFAALNNLTTKDLDKTIFIRTEPLNVCDAIIRQLMHYPYHVGQIIYQSKILLGDQFQSLSIPIGESDLFNKKIGM